MRIEVGNPQIHVILVDPFVVDDDLQVLDPGAFDFVEAQIRPFDAILYRRFETRG